MGWAGAWHRDGSGRTDGVRVCCKVIPLCGLDWAVWAPTEQLVLLPCCLGLQVSFFTVIPFIPFFDQSFVFLSGCAWKSGREWCHSRAKTVSSQAPGEGAGRNHQLLLPGEELGPSLGPYERVFVFAAGGHVAAV